MSDRVGLLEAQYVVDKAAPNCTIFGDTGIAQLSLAGNRAEKMPSVSPALEGVFQIGEMLTRCTVAVSLASKHALAI